LKASLQKFLEIDSDLKNLNLEMFVNLQLIRSTELLISRRYSDQVFRCPVHLSIGQEAIAVGISLNLGLEDKVVSTHRSHAHYIAKGGDIFMMLSELIGSPLGCCKGRGGSMHIFDKSVGFMSSIPIVGSSIPIATGLSLAEKNLNTQNIVVAFVGDACLETGSFYESLNLAALKKLPLFIVLEDNGYSTYSNKEARWPNNKNVKASIEGMGVSYYSGIGDDTEIVYNQAKDIIREVRGNKPSLLHLDTFRRYEHCGPNIDDSMNYRGFDEINSYAERDPLKIMGERLVTSGLISEVQLKNLSVKIEHYVDSIYETMMQRNKDFFADFTLTQ
jgi:TPP-dependent pyruvate/acetoin dehydrogenase alpha subunit